MAVLKSSKATQDDKDAFRALVPGDARVHVKAMFGGLGAFAGTQMFMGLYGDSLMVRLSEAHRADVMAEGGSVFEPMPGRPMREYVTLPYWRDDPGRARPIVARSMEYALSVPPKAARKK